MTGREKKIPSATKRKNKWIKAKKIKTTKLKMDKNN